MLFRSDILSEHNGLGYSGTNSGGDMYIVNSTFAHNRAGIVPNSGSYELCYRGRSKTRGGKTDYDDEYHEGAGSEATKNASANNAAKLREQRELCVAIIACPFQVVALPARKEQATPRSCPPLRRFPGDRRNKW